MRTVQEMIDELRKFPPDAKCWAYEGEAIGVAVDITGGGGGFVYCGPSNGAEPESDGATTTPVDPQDERDRRVGAAVRNCAPDSFDLATTLSEAARELDRDDVQFPIAAGALRAIAAALREEAGR